MKLFYQIFFVGILLAGIATVSLVTRSWFVQPAQDRVVAGKVSNLCNVPGWDMGFGYIQSSDGFEYFFNENGRSRFGILSTKATLEVVQQFAKDHNAELYIADLDAAQTLSRRLQRWEVIDKRRFVILSETPWYSPEVRTRTALLEIWFDPSSDILVICWQYLPDPVDIKGVRSHE